MIIADKKVIKFVIVFYQKMFRLDNNFVDVDFRYLTEISKLKVGFSRLTGKSVLYTECSKPKHDPLSKLLPKKIGQFRNSEKFLGK